jgi:hypothetical protein
VLRPGVEQLRHDDRLELLPLGGPVATLRRFGYFVGGFKGQSVHVAPYFDQAGEPAAQTTDMASSSPSQTTTLRS